jgi:hypothetical protein
MIRPQNHPTATADSTNYEPPAEKEQGKLIDLENFSDMECLSKIRCFMVLMLMLNFTEVSADGIPICKPCSESQVLLPEYDPE